jgi:hypothetical protein
MANASRIIRRALAFGPMAFAFLQLFTPRGAHYPWWPRARPTFFFLTAAAARRTFRSFYIGDGHLSRRLHRTNIFCVSHSALD